MADPTIEQTWVTVKEAAEITGYTPGWMTKWARDMFDLPEAERAIRVRNETGRYELWLPDLIDFVEKYAAGRVNTDAEEIWVNATEGAGITGYSAIHLRKIVRENWKLPDDQRLIKIRKRSHGYDMWLPDLIMYIAEHGHGPYQKTRRKDVDKES
jgi:hypothetical protein